MNVFVESVIIKTRIADAARTLRYAQKESPGDDLGQQAIAVCVLELDEALADLSKLEGVPGFDHKASLEFLMKKWAAR
jgi:hypothetical protein